MRVFKGFNELTFNMEDANMLKVSEMKKKIKRVKKFNTKMEMIHFQIDHQNSFFVFGVDHKQETVCSARC